MLIYYHNYSASARISERLWTDKTKELGTQWVGMFLLMHAIEISKLCQIIVID